MALWGKLVGGTAGLMLGGALGALIGLAAGHAFDHLTTPAEEPPPPDQALKSTAFTIGVIALAAKMAKADGEVHHAEVAAFQEIHQVDPDEAANVARLFDLARRHSAGFESYAEQIARLFTPASPVLEELLGGLAHIARADGIIHPAERDYLFQVARIFGFDDANCERIIRSHLGNEASRNDPWIVLGIAPGSDDAAIRTAYLKLVRDHHPDRLIAEGLPPEAIAIANETLAAINTAYDALTRRQKQS
jgi:DnaJ like chaperone protein